MRLAWKIYYQLLWEKLPQKNLELWARCPCTFTWEGFLFFVLNQLALKALKSWQVFSFNIWVLPIRTLLYHTALCARLTSYQAKSIPPKALLIKNTNTISEHSPVNTLRNTGHYNFIICWSCILFYLVIEEFLNTHCYFVRGSYSHKRLTDSLAGSGWKSESNKIDFYISRPCWEEGSVDCIFICKSSSSRRCVPPFILLSKMHIKMKSIWETLFCS